MIEQPATVQSTMQFVVDFLDDPESVEKILSDNYLAFHKHKENT